MDIDYLRAPFSQSFDSFTFVSRETQRKLTNVYMSVCVVCAHFYTCVFDGHRTDDRCFVEMLTRALDVKPTESKKILDNILYKLDHHGFYVHYDDDNHLEED